MHKFPLKLLTFSLSGYFAALSVFVHASEPADEAEFNTQYLYNLGGGSIDAARFRYRNAVLPGEYPAEIFVNGVRKGQVTLTFREQDGGKVGLCLSRDVLKLLDLKPQAVAEKPGRSECLPTNQVVPQGKFEFITADQRLNLDIAQELQVVRPRGYIPPEQWESGTAAVFTRYRFNYYQTDYINKTDRRRRDRYYLGLHSGATWQGWTLRHRGSLIGQSDEGSRYHAYDTYLQHDIDDIEGRLTLGDFQTHGRVADSIALRGIMLSSEPRMQPNSRSGFAPSVRGIANSNARVTIRQNGQIIYETTVPPGPFTIDDLYPSGHAGDLLVEVMEDNGMSRHFIVPFSNAVQMMRPNQLWYEIAVGRYRQNTHVYPLNVVQGSLQYGLNNLLTLNIGTTWAEKYLAADVGSDWQLWGGTMEAAFRLNRLHQAEESRSLRLEYSKNFSDYGTYLYLNAEHFFSPNSYDLDDAVALKTGQDPFIRRRNVKNRYRLSLNQRLGENLGSLYVSAGMNRYYRTGSNGYNYQITYTNYFRYLEFQVGYWRGKNQNGTNDRNYNAQTGLYGNFGADNQFHYGATVSKYREQTAYSANMGYQAPFADLNATYSRSRYTRQQSYEAAGGIVIHPQGITLSPQLGDTFAVVHAKGANGAKIKNYGTHSLDVFGNAIVPYLVPYRRNQVGVELEELSDDVDISATGKEVVPRANTVHLVRLTTQTGKAALFDVQLAGNNIAPMGAEAFDHNGNLIGYVGQGGRLFARIADSQGEIRLVWGNRENQQCRFHYAINNLNASPPISYGTVPCR